MARLLQIDRRRFMGALEETIGPFLRIGPNQNLALECFPEPVGEIARLHRGPILNVDLQRIACEFDVEKPEDILRAAGEHRLKELGLEALAVQNGVVQRLDWEALNDGLSLMQNLARTQRYTPWRKL